MHVTGLWIHPVKSLGGQAVDSARVEPWGLEGDRRWGLVDPSGEKVTARDLHALVRLHAEQVDDETLVKGAIQGMLAALDFYKTV